MEIQIIDLDNCVCDDEWRLEAINWEKEDPIQRYHDYHCLAAFDQPANQDLFLDLPKDVVLIVFTARPEFFMAPTIEWFRRNGLNASMLFMRENNDFSHSRDLKRKFLVSLVNEVNLPASSIIGAYDDRQDVVDMYNALGVPGILRSVHNTNEIGLPATKFNHRSE